eukprot:9158580-Alexandrium_andersonii.AAC.1
MIVSAARASDAERTFEQLSGLRGVCCVLVRFRRLAPTAAQAPSFAGRLKRATSLVRSVFAARASDSERTSLG